MTLAGVVSGVVAVVLVLSPGASAVNARSDRSLSRKERAAAIQRASVWTRTDVARMPIRSGPAYPGRFEAGATVTCDYTPEKFGGASPKFGCAIAKGDIVKVRYGRDNPEVYASVAASRLLWALGFGADGLYPVHVICRGCPWRLRGDGPVLKGVARFDVATIERRMPGRELDDRYDGGWTWPELEDVGDDPGGTRRMHRDALKLLAVFLQHTDSKPAQQRLLCRDPERGDSEACSAPFLMVHDIGLTFGRANAFNMNVVGSVNFAFWSRTAVWKDASQCVGNLPRALTGTLDNPRISEAGRRFLAGLLDQLTDAQLRDLFEVARFPERRMPGAAGGHSVDEWVETFKKKRLEVAQASCPS